VPANDNLINTPGMDVGTFLEFGTQGEGVAILGLFAMSNICKYALLGMNGTGISRKFGME
jgi:hypothetical protein